MAATVLSMLHWHKLVIFYDWQNYYISKRKWHQSWVSNIAGTYWDHCFVPASVALLEIFNQVLFRFDNDFISTFELLDLLRKCCKWKVQIFTNSYRALNYLVKTTCVRNILLQLRAQYIVLSFLFFTFDNAAGLTRHTFSGYSTRTSPFEVKSWMTPTFLINCKRIQCNELRTR